MLRYDFPEQASGAVTARERREAGKFAGRFFGAVDFFPKLGDKPLKTFESRVDTPVVLGAERVSNAR